jgi:hypothetical protein
MELMERIAIERECERLTYRYCEAVDFGHAARLADVFAVAGVFDNGDLHLVGRDQIRRVFAERQLVRQLRTRHVCTNIHVDVTGPADATGVVYLTLYRRRGPEDRSVPVPETSPAVVGSYHDRYVRADEGWRITARRLEAPFADPAAAGWSTTTR